MNLVQLEESIERLAATPAGESLGKDVRKSVDALLIHLEGGTIRAAERAGGDDHIQR